MRCKVGDLAVIVGADDDSPRELADIGKLVSIVAAGPDFSSEGDSRHHWLCDSVCGLIWVEDTFGRWSREPDAYIPDGALRPIRGSDGADETLAWKSLELA